MDQEIQRRRTFEIIAKWIGNHHGVTITFEPDAVPHADVKERRITLPSNMKIENLDKVIALVLHEAGHIAHSTMDVKKLITCKEEKDILNAAEDVRVDRINIDYLPKIREFYEELVKWEDETYPPSSEDRKKIPVPVLALLDAMRRQNGFGKYCSKDKDIVDFQHKHDIGQKLGNIEYYLSSIENYPREQTYTKEAKRLIQELTDIIYGKRKKGTPEPEPNDDGQGQGQGEGQGKGSGKDCKGKDSALGVGKGDQPGAGNSVGTGKKDGKAPNGNKGGGFFGLEKAPLFEIDPNAHYALDDLSLTEQTVKSFQELLMIKSTRIVNDGVTLNTDNLTAFFTGSIDELFKEVKIEKHKKSKIMFLLDSSGSMVSNDGMCGDTMKTDILISVGKKLTRILEELQEVEGINVDFCVRGFDTAYYVWDKDTWEKEYRQCGGGGTNCELGFQMAQDEILNDKTIDGNKIIILITDGQVGGNQIKAIKDMIMIKGSDIKTMILGIGLYHDFGRELSARNIMSKDLADGEILGSIEDMLE